MATLRQQKTNGNYIAVFRDLNGKQYNRSTKTRDRKAALQIAWEWEALARGESQVAHVRETAAKIWERAHGEKVDVYTVKGWLNKILKEKEGTAAASTFSNWSYAVKSFCDQIGEKADRDLSRITVGDVNSWQNSEKARLHVNTVRMYRGLINTAFDRARMEGLIQTNPFDGAEKVKAVDAIRGKFKEEQIKDLLKVANHEWRGMILCGLYGGMRIGDAARLTWKNLDMEAGEISYKPQKTTERTGKHSFVITGPLQRYIAALPAGKTMNAPLFPSLHGQKSSTLAKHFADLLTLAGIEREKDERKGSRRTRFELSFHSLKHSLVTFMKLSGVPEAVAMKAVGHHSRAVSAIYTGVEESDVRKAYEALPDLWKDEA
jgi:integrase